MSKFRKIHAGALLAGIALPLIAPAQAQTAPQDASNQSYGINDIVVTAQRREERAQDVPIVISAFSAEKLKQLNINQPQELYGNVPSLVSGPNGQASRDVQSFSVDRRAKRTPLAG